MNPSLRSWRFFVLCGLILTISLAASPARAITIQNHSGQVINVRAYYVRGGLFGMTITQAGKIVHIDHGQVVTYDRPPMAFGADREIVISNDPVILADTLTQKRYDATPHFNIGVTQGEAFHVGMENGAFKGYNAAQWAVLATTRAAIGSIEDAFQKKVDEALAPLRKAVETIFKTHPYANRTATVRVGTALCREEMEFRTNRKRRIRPELEKKFGLKISDSQVPVIGLVVSGGGYRAMIGCCGFLMGADETGILDVTMYLATLSGSTWAVGPWLMGKDDIGRFRMNLAAKVEQDLFSPTITKSEAESIILNLMLKDKMGQPITGIDLYGSLLARKLLSDLGDSRQFDGLSLMIPRISRAEDPFPIFTAVSNNISPDSNYAWFEFTPYEVGSDFLKAFVPSWAWNRPFSNGTSQMNCPEPGLGFGMGIFGSAFALRVQDIVDRIFPQSSKEGMLLKALVTPILQKYGLSEEGVRKTAIIPGGQVLNWALGLSQTPNSARKQPIIEMADAGMQACLPFYPLLRPERTPDILIALDMGDEAPDAAPALRAAEKYLNQRGIPFPKIDYSQLGHDNLNIFGDPKKRNVPVVLYIPNMKNTALQPPFNNFDPHSPAVGGLTGYASVANFRYSRDHFLQWSEFVRANTANLAPRILEVIKERTLAKK